MRSVLMGAAAATALMLGASSAQSATVLNVSWTSDCGKSTCFNDNGVFTQTFGKSGFEGPVLISQLLMDRGVLGSLDGKAFRLSFQLNGEELGSWGTYNMGGIGGDELSFGGEQFVWNPEDGDLVLVLALIPPPKEGAGGGGGVGMAIAAFEDQPENDVPPFNQPDLNQNEGGEEGGEEQPRQVGPVPEPATWAMMIAGFGMAGAMFRRRGLTASA